MESNRLLCAALIAVLLILAAAGPWLLRDAGRRPQILRSFWAWRYGAEYLGEENVIRQSGSNDCGIACLKMIFDRHGIAVTVENLRTVAELNKDGLSMLALKKTAGRFGLDAAILRLGDGDIARAPLPAIAYLDRSHFVVIDSIGCEDRLIVLDPAGGKLRYSLDAFRKRWAGETIIFAKR